MKIIAIIEENNIHIFDSSYTLLEDSSKYILKTNKTIKNFYDANISSFTCISGKNGVGKTTFLNKIFSYSFSSEVNNMTMIYEKKDNEIFVVGNHVIQTESDIKIVPNENTKFEKSQSFYYSNSLETKFATEVKSTSKRDISTTSILLQKDYKKMLIEDMYGQLRFLLFFEKLEVESMVENKNIIDFSKISAEIEISSRGKAILEIFGRYFKGMVIKSLFKKEKKEIEKVLLVKILINYASILDEKEFEDFRKVNSILSKNKKEIEYSKLLKMIKTNIQKSEKYDEQLKLALDAEKFYMKSIPIVNKLNFPILKDRQKNKNSFKDLDILLKEYNNENIFIQDMYSLFFFKWNKISSGEFNLLNIFGRFYSCPKLEEPDCNLLIIDEGDLGFHPEWQRRWVSIVPKILGVQFKEKKVNTQLVISTHSPILLSDIRSQDIIFYGENGYKKGTFGQNIQSLLVDSFSLESSIGHFAEEKIKNIQKSITPLSQQIIESQMDIDTIEKLLKSRNIILDIENKFGVLSNDTKNKINIIRERQSKEKNKATLLYLASSSFVEDKESIISDFEIRTSVLLNIDEDIRENEIRLKIVEQHIQYVSEPIYRGALMRKLERISKNIKRNG